LENVFKNSSLNYLNCRKIQVVNHFYNRDLPLGYYYYHALESTDKVFDEIINMKKRKWHFNSNVLSDFAMKKFGINPIFIPFEQLRDVKDLMHDLLHKNKIVFLWVRSSEVLHNTTLDPESIHSIIVTEFLDKEEMYKIQDIPFYSDIIYDFEDLERMCNDIPNYVSKNLVYYDYLEDNLNVESLKSKQIAYIKYYEDKLEFYDYLSSLFSPSGTVSDELFKTSIWIDDALSIIAGSRYLFANGLLKLDWNKIYYDLFMLISKDVEKLKIMMSLSLVRKRYNSKEILNLIDKIKKMEREAMLLLQNNLDNNIEKLSEMVSSIRVQRPGRPELIKANNTNMKIKWNDSVDNIWVTSYGIFKDGELVGESNQLQFNIKDILPDTSYAISVRARDAFGNSSEMSIINHIKIDTSIQNKDMALFKPVVTSSDEISFRGGDKVVDGRRHTRWGSSHAEDISWVYIDLGNEVEFSTIMISWEEAYAIKYKIQCSNNANDWNDIYVNHDGYGGVEKITDLNGRGRYIKILCEEKATIYGYSIWNISVFE